MNSDLIKDFNLPSYIKGKSFAEASKAIDKKFSERTDSAALETKEELLGRLAKAQEFVKMQESLKANSSEVPDMMNGQVPEGFEDFAPQNQMAEGGVVPDAPVGQGVDPVGTAIGAAGTFLDLGYEAMGPTGVVEDGTVGRQESINVGMNAGKSALKGAAAGAAIGSVVPVIGTAIGGIVGGVGGAVSGVIGGNKKNKAIHEGNMNASRIQNNKYSNDFALGGFTDPTDPRKKKVATDTTKVNDTIFAVEPIHPVGGIQDRVNVGPETPKLDGSAQAAYLETVKYAGRKKAKPGDINPNAGLPPAGAFDNQFIDYPAAQPTVPTIPAKSGETVGELLHREQGEEQAAYLQGIKDKQGQSQADYLATVSDKGMKDYDYFNDPENKLNGQGEDKEDVTIDGTITEEEATPEQRKAMEVLSLKYKPSGVKSFTPGLAESAKAATDALAKTNAQGKARDKKIAEIISEHEANKPEGFKLNASRLAEFAPAAMSAYQLATLKKPQTESLDRVDSRYKTDYVDEKALENRVQNEHNNVSRALAGASNGSMGALRANLLGANKNKVEAMSDAYLKADDINRQEDRAAQQFNSRNDMVNLQQSNREKENAARDKAAYENNKSMLLSTIGDNIGAIGREATDRKTIAKMFGYDVEGNYVVGKDGKKKTWKEFDKEVKAYQKKTK